MPSRGKTHTSETRQTSLALISMWLHDDPIAGEHLEPDAQASDLALIAAAFLRCWAQEAGLAPEVLLADIAVGQALGMD